MVSKARFRLACGAAMLATCLAAPSWAQLDLGSPQIPRDSIDAYMKPFYRLVATGMGADRYLHVTQGLGWEAGLEAAAVPIPGGAPFTSVALSALPLFRAGAGLGWQGLAASARGLVWRDPRVGDLAVFGAEAGYGRALSLGNLPVTLALLGAWDRLVFSSTYVYHYRGSPLGLADQDVPGDYTLTENGLALGASGELRRGPWGFSLQGWYEWTNGRFRYLYFDPVSGNRQRVDSDLDVPGLRAAAGLTWRGLRLEAGFRSFAYAAVGWAWEAGN